MPNHASFVQDVKGNMGIYSLRHDRGCRMNILIECVIQPRIRSRQLEEQRGIAFWRNFRLSPPFQGVEGSPNSGLRAGIPGRCFGTLPTVKIGANRLSRTADHKKYFHVRVDTRKRRNEEEEWRRDSGPMGPMVLGHPSFAGESGRRSRSPRRRTTGQTPSSRSGGFVVAHEQTHTQRHWCQMKEGREGGRSATFRKATTRRTAKSMREPLAF